MADGDRGKKTNKQTEKLAHVLFSFCARRRSLFRSPRGGSTRLVLVRLPCLHHMLARLNLSRVNHITGTPLLSQQKRRAAQAGLFHVRCVRACVYLCVCGAAIFEEARPDSLSASASAWQTSGGHLPPRPPHRSPPPPYPPSPLQNNRNKTQPTLESRHRQLYSRLALLRGAHMLYEFILAAPLRSALLRRRWRWGTASVVRSDAIM